MILIDTHIHLDAEDFRNDLPDVITRARNEGIQKMLVPNVDKATSGAVMDICSKYPDLCFPMMGLHPTSVNGSFENELKHIEGLLRAHGFVAVGEIGIDLYWDKTYFKEQQTAFVRQMELARELGLPAVIHSRRSLEEILAIMKKQSLLDIPCIFHCFPGSLEQAKRLTGMGHVLGIGGVVTFKNASLAGIVKEIPLEYIVLETDAPWLAPVPYRGKRNEPAYIKLIAQKVAEIKEIALDEVAETTTRTALRLFPGIPA